MASVGTIFNIQHYSVHDGPGIRTVVFLKGCPLRCKWCGNPESQLKQKQIAWNKGSCIGCKSCVNDLNDLGCCFKNDGLYWDKNATVPADRVKRVCPSEALHIIGEDKTALEVLDIVLRDAVFYKNSGGGLTLSGGEPLMQPEFTIELLTEAKKQHIHCAMETSGFAKWEVFKEVAGLLDYLFIDLKCLNDEIHIKNTGVSNKLILENITKVYNEYPDLKICVRTPVIPGVNDKEDEILSIVKFLNNMPNVQYELLKYHRFGIPKYESLNIPYPMGDVELTEEKFQQLKNIAESNLHR